MDADLLEGAGLDRTDSGSGPDHSTSPMSASSSGFAQMPGHPRSRSDMAGCSLGPVRHTSLRRHRRTVLHTSEVLGAKMATESMDDTRLYTTTQYVQSCNRR